MTIPPILKNKWVLMGGGLVVVLALLMSSKGSATTQVVAGSSAPTDAQVAASRDITIAQLNAQVQTNAANAQIAQINASGQVDLAKATLDSTLQRYAIDAQTAANNLQYATNRDVQLASIASSDRQALASIDSQTAVAKMTLDQATANATIQTNFQLDYAEAANATSVSLAQMQAQLVNNQLVANRDVTLAGLATQEQLAAINANLQQNQTYSNNATQAAVYASMIAGQNQLAETNANQQIATTQINANAQKYINGSGNVKGVLGFLGGIFSDPALKENIELVGVDQNGLGIYAYNYKVGHGERHLGVMADEVAALRPDALGPIVSGFATVNYDLLQLAYV